MSSPKYDEIVEELKVTNAQQRREQSLIARRGTPRRAPVACFGTVLSATEAPRAQHREESDAA